MRTLVIFALAVIGMGILTDNAQAFGKRRRAKESCGCAGGAGYMGMPYAGGYQAAASGCCGSTGMAYGTYGAPSAGYGSMYYPGGTYPGAMYPGNVYPAGYNSPYIPGGTLNMPGTTPGTTGSVPNPMPGK
jgi:hypothetical protein